MCKIYIIIGRADVEYKKCVGIFQKINPLNIQTQEIIRWTTKSYKSRSCTRGRIQQ